MAAPHSTIAGRRQRYGALLVAIVISFAVQGIATPDRWEQVFVSVLLSIVLLLALWTADSKAWVIRSAIVIAVAVTVTSFVEALNGTVDDRAVRLADALLVALAPPAVIIGVVRTLRAKGTVTLEAVFGVLCLYLLLGMFFAFVYGAINHLGGSAFFAGGQQASVPSCLYFSFTTLTTVGYGDLTARSNLGHTLSVSEALVGQIYLVTVVSVLVANLGRGRPTAQAE